MNLPIIQLAGYRVQERIGVGGMGEVYKAFHPGLNRVAAIKILYQKEMAERFRNEAYIQSSVSHPNIAKLYEYVTHEHTPCIIMEYVEGTTLDALIAKKGKLGNEETEKILAQVASALSYLHQRDILHRDIKPQNFKVEPDGTVKMLDFGISKNKYTPKLTQLGFVVGTTEYMAPEQFQQEVNKKSDVWSLGVMVYEMLTGHLPFDAGNPISLRAMIMKGKFTDPRILVPHVSENLSIIIDRSLRINPASRMPAEEIENLLRGKPKKMNESETWKLPSWNWKFWMYLPIGLALVIFLFLVFSNNNAAVTPPETTDSIAVINQGVKTTALKLIINVPSVPDARIVLSDGSVHAIPYIISGEEGSKLDFLIRADGYEEKKVQGLEFNTRRTTYEYRLKKINQ